MNSNSAAATTDTPDALCADRRSVAATILSRLTSSPAGRLLLASCFRYLWAGQLVSQIGDGVNKIALLWFVYQLTGSALQMAVIGILQSVPALFLSPFLGVLIDRLPSKRLLIALDLSRVVLVALFPILYFAGALSLPVIYALTLVVAISSSAFGPTMASALPKLVGKDDLTAANGLVHNATTVGVLVGPAVGGLLAALIGAQNVLFIDSATFLFSAGCLALLSFPAARKAAESVQQKNVISDLVEGLRFVFRGNPMIRCLMFSSALYAVGVGAFPILLPIFAKQSLHMGSAWLGGLWSGLGVGMVLATIFLAVLHKLSREMNLYLAGGGIAVAAASAFALSSTSNPYIALGLVALFGAGTALFSPIMWTLVQKNTPTKIRGRVFALVATTDMAAVTLSMALVGFLADRFGPDASLAVVGIALICAASYLASIAMRPRSLALAAGRHVSSLQAGGV